MARTYTTEGRTRGGCGHQHRHIRTALQCLLRERTACLSLGVHSDRGVVRGDGSPLSDEEADTLIVLLQQRRAQRVGQPDDRTEPGPL